MPPVAQGASYIDISASGGIETALRRVREVWHERVPRKGVFVSYAHKDDESWLKSLLTNFSWLQRNHAVEIWTDQEIVPGAKWHEEIQVALQNAKAAVLLVTPDFLNSDYVLNNELPQLLQDAESEELTVFWIPVRPSSYRHSPIAAFQAAWPPEKALSSLSPSELDQALVNIGEKLFDALGLGRP